MTVYTKSMMESLAEVRGLQEDNMDLMRKAAGGAAQKVKFKDKKSTVDSFTASAIMKVYDKVNPVNQKKMEKIINSGNLAQFLKLQSMAMKAIKSEYDAALDEEVELDEAKYEIYHKDFSSAMQHAYKMAKKLHGITVDPKEIDDKVATGPKTPSSGKTNSYRLKGDKGAIQVQVANLDNKKYELNMYKEETELDEVFDFVLLDKDNKIAGRYSGSNAKKEAESGKKSAHLPPMRIPKNEVGKMKIVPISPKDKKGIGDTVLAIGEEVELEEGKMKELHGYIKKGMSAEEIAKKMKLDVKTIKALMAGYNEAYEVGTDEYREYTQDITPGEPNKVDEASARADAMRAMRRGKEVDPADVDDTATDADIKAASKNILMQMRKVVNLGGKFDVEFLDKKKVKVKPAIANAFIKKYQSMRKPADKEKFQNQAMKSYKDLLKVLKASYMMAQCMPEEVELDEKKIVLAKGMGREVVNIDGEIKLMKGGKVISTGDYDRGAGKFFMDVKGEKGQVAFSDPKDILKIKEEADLDEGTWKKPKNKKQIAPLLKLMRKPIKLGKEGDDALDVVSPYIGDDELSDDLYTAGKKNPNGDARPAIRDALQRFGLPWEEELELDEMKSGNYALAVKGKFVAVGSKADMMKMKKQKGGEIYMSPGAKVGDKAEEVELDEALPSHLQKFFDKDGNPKSKEGKAAWERIAKSKGFKKYTDKQIKMAIGVAFDKRYVQGNMTGAAKTIEKIAKGLSNIEPVRDALRRANEEVVKEGTWAVPKTSKQKSALKKLLSKPLDAKGATDKLYNIIGDDELFDEIDDFADTEPKADVRSMVRTAMKRLGIKEETILERIDRKLKERKNG